MAASSSFSQRAESELPSPALDTSSKLAMERDFERPGAVDSCFDSSEDKLFLLGRLFLIESLLV